MTDKLKKVRNKAASAAQSFIKQTLELSVNCTHEGFVKLYKIDRGFGFFSVTLDAYHAKLMKDVIRSLEGKA